MLTHVGRVLYWLGSILAAAILLFDLLLVAWDDEPHSPYSGYILIGYLAGSVHPILAFHSREKKFTRSDSTREIVAARRTRAA